MERKPRNLRGIVLIVISLLYLIFSMGYIHSAGEYLHYDQIILLRFIAYSVFTLLLAIAIRDLINPTKN